VSVAVHGSPPNRNGSWNAPEPWRFMERPRTVRFMDRPPVGGYSWIALEKPWWITLDRWRFMDRPQKIVAIHGSPPTVAVHGSSPQPWWFTLDRWRFMDRPPTVAVHGSPPKKSVEFMYHPSKPWRFMDRSGHPPISREKIATHRILSLRRDDSSASFTLVYPSNDKYF